jgi:hypothetical protein
MSVEVITREDLQVFRLQLINDIRHIGQQKPSIIKDWQRSIQNGMLLKPFIKILSIFKKDALGKNFYFFKFNRIIYRYT